MTQHHINSPRNANSLGLRTKPYQEVGTNRDETMSVLFTEPKKLYQIFLNIWKELNNEVFSLAVQLAPLLYQLGYRIPGYTS